jgi:hypothetical protein
MHRFLYENIYYYISRPQNDINEMYERTTDTICYIDYSVLMMGFYIAIKILFKEHLLLGMGYASIIPARKR